MQLTEQLHWKIAILVTTILLFVIFDEKEIRIGV